MKTPEGIKKGLKCLDCADCPYYESNYDDGLSRCHEAADDALAYIEQLEDHIRDTPKKATKGEREIMTATKNPHDRSIFAQRLRKARLAKGWTQRELAWYLRTDQGRVINWENDKHTPRIGALTEIAKLLGVRVDWLLGEGE